MAPRIYFGGADEQSPIPAQSTSDWNTVYPPEVQAEAWKFEMAKRAADRQRELEDMIFRESQNQKIEDVTKAVDAAQRFQAQRQYESLVANGTKPSVALAQLAPKLFRSPAGLGPIFRPQVQRVMNVAGTGYQEQEDGTWKPFTPIKAPVVKDSTAASLKKRIDAAQAEFDKAQMNATARQATREEVTPAVPGSRFWGIGPKSAGTPAITNQIPIFLNTTKTDEAVALRDAARNRLKQAQTEYAAYMQQATNAGPAEAQEPPPRPLLTGPPGSIGGAMSPPATLSPSAANPPAGASAAPGIAAIAPPGTNAPVPTPIVRPPGPPASGTGLKTNEVLRRVNGKLAIFDSKTRKFLRYAD